MEVVKTENVKVQNAVLVSGLTNTDIDNEIIEFLEAFGPVSRHIKLPTGGQIIVEFQHEATVKELEKRYLPCDRPCTVKPEVIYRIRDLASAYSIETSASATVTYLSQLKDVAARSNRSFKDLLMDELAKIGESLGGEVHTAEPSTEQEPVFRRDEALPSPPLTANSDHVSAWDDAHPPVEAERPTPQIPTNLLSTPEVQRVIVEHIVKSSDVVPSPNSQYRLKPFSGRVPHPHFETDYDTWRSSVEFCLTDPSFTETQVVRKIVESLSPPAADLVKALGPKANPKTYLEHLDSAYATVEDGDELFARFLNTNQNGGEKPSYYLQRLHTVLNLVIKRDGIASSDVNKQLLRQFCRGCWDSSLIANLQLEQKKDDPPHFAELLLQLRTEEDKQASKANRMKQHLGVQKTRAYSSMQTTCPQGRNDYEHEMDHNSADLQKQIADLRTQIAQLRADKTEKRSKKPQKEAKPNLSTKTHDKLERIPQIAAVSAKPKPGYCFKCGEDGHIASNCSNEANPALVAAKRNALRHKQREWELSRPVGESFHLN
ncbi:zinc finger CCHC domain-containing protein 12-like [Clarias gariepinus]|uniref:zinc finger CCHC domain-containing protein 12-like n=1 Tax=Clarias gariepinus TaxID=13013 RepID=UPI00234C9AA3|nr:zinc finger CCHC domain-containing protein 12-like [Clarias gariepinus]